MKKQKKIFSEINNYNFFQKVTPYEFDKKY